MQQMTIIFVLELNYVTALHVTGYSPTHQGSLQGRAKTSAVEADGRDVVWGWSQRDFWLCKPPEVVRGVICHPSAVPPPGPPAPPLLLHQQYIISARTRRRKNANTEWYLCPSSQPLRLACFSPALYQRAASRRGLINQPPELHFAKTLAIELARRGRP